MDTSTEKTFVVARISATACVAAIQSWLFTPSMIRTRTFELWDGALRDEATRSARELNAKCLREIVMRDKGSLLLYFAGYKTARPERSSLSTHCALHPPIAGKSDKLYRLESTHPNRSFPDRKSGGGA